MKHVKRLVPDSTPAAAMELLLSEGRFVLRDQDWSGWQWWAERYGTTVRERIEFRYDGQKFVRL